MSNNYLRAVAGFLVALLVSSCGYFIHLNDQRISRLELWRENHERYSRERSEAIESRLVRMEEKQDYVIQKLESLK